MSRARPGGEIGDSSPPFHRMTPVHLPEPSPPAPARPASPLLRWGVVLAIWGALAAMDITQTRLYFEMWEEQYGWAEAVRLPRSAA